MPSFIDMVLRWRGQTGERDSFSFHQHCRATKCCWGAQLQLKTIWVISNKILGTEFVFRG